MEENQDIKRVWTQLDGALNEKEQADFLQKLQEDPELSAAFAEAQQLEAHLKEVEADEPSMRFTANVLDQLPVLYKKVSVEPVLSQQSLWRGVLLLLASVLLSFTAALSGTGTGSGENSFIQWQSYLDKFMGLPSSALMIAALTGFCIVSVFAIDQVLKKRFLSKRT
ncbi:MAG TPA: hypothetical protein VJ953_14245 [Saprospiraceae bacterium]|nr:hypothetical protein [Saprospiraceae bacterium]